MSLEDNVKRAVRKVLVAGAVIGMLGSGCADKKPVAEKQPVNRDVAVRMVRNYFIDYLQRDCLQGTIDTNKLEVSYWGLSEDGKEVIVALDYSAEYCSTRDLYEVSPDSSIHRIGAL